MLSYEMNKCRKKNSGDKSVTKFKSNNHMFEVLELFYSIIYSKMRCEKSVWGSYSTLP